MSFTRDRLSRPGAEVLARIIADYWLLRGKLVTMRIESEHLGHDLIYVVRSDMIGGQPR